MSRYQWPFGRADYARFRVDMRRLHCRGDNPYMECGRSTVPSELAPVRGCVAVTHRYTEKTSLNQADVRISQRKLQRICHE